MANYELFYFKDVYRGLDQCYSTMEPANYLPPDDGEKLNWLNNFIEKLQLYAGSLGFSDNNTIVIEQDIQKFRSLLKIKIEYHHSQSLYGLRGISTNKSDASRSGRAPHSSIEYVPSWMFKRLSRTVKEIKESTAYKESIGMEMGLIRSDKTACQSPDFKGVSSSIIIDNQINFDHNH